MTLTIQSVSDSHTWDTFLFTQNPDTFLQSWNWKTFNEQSGEKTVTLGAYQDGNLVGVALGIVITAKRGTFLFCPHGPIVSKTFEDAYISLLDALKKEATKKGCRFLRVSPLLQNTPEYHSFYHQAGFRDAPIHMHAETMWILDISPSEDQLLANMRKTTRNLIRRAGKEGVRVRFSTNPDDIEKFSQLYTETAERENFVPFSHTFLQKEFEAFSSNVLLALAEHEGEVLAAAIVPIFGMSGFYHQGASSRKRSKIPAAYLLHWEIIRELKKRNVQKYNFWGIAPQGDKNHPWSGLTQFKTGFGGEQTAYLHAQDFPLSAAYWMTFLVEYARRKRRGY